jgi:hypothetical protein
MKYLLLICCLVVIWSTPLSALEVRLLQDASEQWQERGDHGDPADAKEQLAVQAAESPVPLTFEYLSAYVVKNLDDGVVVVVEEASEDGSAGPALVSSYQIRERKIIRSARPIYRVRPHPQKEEIAREIARDFVLGRLSPHPLIYNGLVYSAVVVDKCVVAVIAKGEGGVDFTYRYFICK